jgi:DNA-binding response OmpR family regulator
MECAHHTVLLVEDDPLVGMDVERVLADAGYRVIGPAGNSADALAILGRESPDLTILDLNLHGEMAFAVFDVLDEAGRPFIILSGHSRQVVPSRHARRPFLQKPCDDRVLLRAVHAAIGDQARKVSAATD